MFSLTVNWLEVSLLPPYSAPISSLHVLLISKPKQKTKKSAKWLLKSWKKIRLLVSRGTIRSVFHKKLKWASLFWHSVNSQVLWQLKMKIRKKIQSKISKYDISITMLIILAARKLNLPLPTLHAIFHQVLLQNKERSCDDCGWHLIHDWFVAQIYTVLQRVSFVFMIQLSRYEHIL